MLLVSRARLITTIKCPTSASFTTMSAAEPYPDLFANVLRPKHELLEVHRSKISLHRAKAGYDYPTIRLPHTFSKLAELSTRIYQTVHRGALAFLVVVSNGTPTEKSAEKSENCSTSAKTPALTWRRSPVRIRPSPSVFFNQLFTSQTTC